MTLARALKRGAEPVKDFLVVSTSRNIRNPLAHRVVAIENRKPPNDYRYYGREMLMYWLACGAVFEMDFIIQLNDEAKNPCRFCFPPHRQGRHEQRRKTIDRPTFI